MTWIALATQQTSIADAARLMNCNAATAKRRLEQAIDQLDKRHDNCVAAASLLKHTGYKNPHQVPDMSARHWQDVALGLKRAF